MFWRVIRGMLPHKTARGKAALQRLKVFEGIPYPYDGKKRMVVPEALKLLRVKSYRNTCLLGDLASGVGWTKADVVKTLEAKRKVKSDAYYKKKQVKIAAKAKAMEGKGNKVIEKANKELKAFGF